MPEPEVISGAEMKRRLDEIYGKVRLVTTLIDSGGFMTARNHKSDQSLPHHVIAQKRAWAQKCLDEGAFKNGWTLTFHDEEGDDAYCIATVEQQQLSIKCKTFGSLGDPEPN